MYRTEEDAEAVVIARGRMTRKANKWLNIAACLANEHSKDQSTKVGAIILGPDWEVRSTGYNGPPRGVNDDVPERHERPEKYFWAAHAEENAIAQAARSGASTNGCMLVVSALLPCAACARMIINAGIMHVFARDAADDGLRERWAEDNARTITMFREAGVGLWALSPDGNGIRYYNHRKE